MPPPIAPSALRLSGAGVDVTLDPCQSWAIGRHATNDVVITHDEVSRRHARLEHRSRSGWVLIDAGSANGTWLAGRRVTEVNIDRPCEVWLGVIGRGALLQLSPRTRREGPQPLANAPLTVGRDVHADVMIPDLSVSRKHATLRFLADGHVLVADHASGNGTFINGSRVRKATAFVGDLITFGRSEPYQVDVQGLVPYASGPKGSLVADQLVVRTASGKTILDKVSFALDAGQLLAVVGTTGAGKSTLTKALTAFRPADEGRVFLDGRELYGSLDELQPQIGYVPQDDILHPQLRVRDALAFGAELRFPSDVSAADRSARVEEVMRELGLTQHATTPIHKLSGGQRKRTSVALELLTRPRLLLLDEPTSGLDPGYEKKVMQLLRELADGNRTVAVVTHSVQSLQLCDRVLFLAPGGRVAFFGPPDQAQGFFGEVDYAEIFSLLEEDTAGSWAARFRASSHFEHYLAEPLRSLPPAEAARAAGVSVRPARDPVQQTLTLIRRQAAVMAADRRQFGVLLGATVVGGLVILLALQGHSLDPAHPPPVDGRKLIGTLALAASVLGAASGLREIVKERSILDRERATGLSLSAYLASKAVVVGAVCLLQAALLAILSTVGAGGPAGGALLPSGRIELILGTAAMTFVGMTLGLLISSVVATSEQAMSLIVLVIIFEYVLSGAAIDLSGVTLLEVPSYLSGSNWGVAALASTSDLPLLDRCGPAPSSSGPTLTCDGRWVHSAPQWIWNMLALTLLASATLALTLWVLVRRYRPVSRVSERPVP